MLDVHPPHASVHSWRDFFIHIATIVIGLCIAVGLEQAVEYIHFHYQVAETREALRVEEEQNARRFALQTRQFLRMTPALQTDLAILLYLRAHPHAPPQSWPGEFHWNLIAGPYSQAAWKTAQQDGVVEHMPPAEVQRFDDLYTRLERIYAAEAAAREACGAARSFLIRDPDPTHLTPADIDKVLDRMTEGLVAYARSGDEQRRLAVRFPNFSPAPTVDDIAKIEHYKLAGQEKIDYDEEVREFNSIDNIH
jgi:hypothetical protein